MKRIDWGNLRFVVCNAMLLVVHVLAAQSLPALDEVGVSHPLIAFDASSTLPDAPQAQTTSGNSLEHPDTTSVTDRQPVPAKGCLAKTSNALPTAEAHCKPRFDIFYPLGKPPTKGRLSSMDKLRIGASNVVDPFNLATIGISAGITIGSDPDTAYGPGMKGWAKNAGTLLTEDMSGTFFVTFLVPSIVRQDPRYYRMPHASIPRRIGHALIHPIWTKSDSGNPMPNLANFIGIPATITLANVYVPNRKQGVGPTAQSSAIAIASAPIDSLTTEFLPDVAKHFKIRIVLIQQIVNHIALTGGQE